MSLPAGTYYVGDLCYVLKNSWDAVCNMVIADRDCLDGEFKLPDGRVFAMYNTAFGDGLYNDQYGNEYCVDSGSIGCIRLDDCDVNLEKIIDDGLGKTFQFANSFKTYSDGRTINIGRVCIDTDPSYDEQDVDEAQEWHDYDPDC